MNMARYLSLFDRASDDLLALSGVTSCDSDLTFVAARVQMAHRRELFEGDVWQVWSGFASVQPRSMIFVHRLTSDGAVRATCSIYGTPFSMQKRTSTVLAENQIGKIAPYVVTGLGDPFEDRTHTGRMV